MYDGIVQDLIDELGRLPGVGPKSAQRIAFHILQTQSFDVSRLATLLTEVREKVRASQGAERRAALLLARKRGFGPFGLEPLDRPRREKQIAAMLRAGHPLDSARELVDAASVEAAEDWAAAGLDEERN